MAITVSTIQTRLTNRLKDISDIDNSTLFQMATDLNQHLYNEMFKADPERYITTQSYTVSSSPSTQALPSGFRDIQEYGCGFYLQNDDGTASDVRLEITGYGASEMGYYILGSNVVFTGIDSTKTIVLRYVPVLDDIDSLSDSFVAPDENKELILEGMVLYYYRYEEDPRELEQDQRFMSLQTWYGMKLTRTPGGEFTLYRRTLGGNGNDYTQLTQTADNTTTEADYVCFNMDVGDKIIYGGEEDFFSFSKNLTVR